MNIKTTDNDVSIILAPEEWVAADSNEYKKNITEYISQGNNKLVFDFSMTNFIDSTGIGSLVAILKFCRQHKGDLYLCSLPPKVKTIIELTQLQKIFKIFDTPEQAVKSF